MSAARPSWVLIAPVFDRHHQCNGLWVEMRVAEDQADTIVDMLTTQLLERPPQWLFVGDHEGCLRGYLPLALPSEQMLVYPAALEMTGQANTDGLLLALRGTRAELAGTPRSTEASWHVVTDPAGRPSGRQALADGRQSWQQCAPLADLGWRAFLLTGNARVGGKQPKADQLALTRLLGLITSDADTAELESLFKTQPNLAFDLLNLVNSPALNLRTPATSFRHAITLLGRRQLQRWLQLLMFTRQTSKKELNILLWHSALRGRAMELLAGHLGMGHQSADQAFMVGVFSLIDVLLNDSLENLLDPLALEQPILAALVERKGPLGDLLRLVMAIEARDGNALGDLAAAHGIDVATLLRIQLASLFWIESFSMTDDS